MAKWHRGKSLAQLEQHTFKPIRRRYQKILLVVIYALITSAALIIAAHILRGA